MVRRTRYSILILILASMLASTPRAAASSVAVLAARAAGRRGGGRATTATTTGRHIASKSAHYDHSQGNATTATLVRRKNLPYRAGGGAAFEHPSSVVSRRPSFVSLSIALRGGGADVGPRNNSTRAAAAACGESGRGGRRPLPPWRRAYLAVGSNLGDCHRNIASALSDLESDTDGAVRVLRTSHLRMTSPMYVTDQPAFLNGAVEVETTLGPMELLRALKRAEAGAGRDVGPDSEAVRYGPRPVDLDILLFDGYEVIDEDGTAADTLGENGATPNALVMRTEELEIPHPRMAEREFVLSPMRDLERADRGGIVHPLSNQTMEELLSSLRRRSNHAKEDEEAVRVLPLPNGRMLYLNETIVMGILNVTPDSFSDGGRYSASVERAAEEALLMVRDGAGVIDVGGESTRPGADDVDALTELDRVIPVIERIRARGSDVPISIDTRRAAVAEAAVGAGADIVNDVSGGTHDPGMLPTVARLGVPMIIMHMRGNPRTMQSLTNYGDDRDGSGMGGVVSVVARELMERSAAAERAGIPRWLQVLDPGVGFAKDADGSLSLLGGADVLRGMCDGLPFLFGPSRKGFIGKIVREDDPEERDYGTVAACLASIGSVGGDGNEACNILRVHNVKAVKQAVLVYEAIRNAK